MFCLNRVKVLHIEDDAAFSGIVKKSLERFGKVKFQLDHADTLIQAETMIKENKYDVVLLDIDLLDSEGLNTLINVLALLGKTAVIVISSSIDDEDLIVKYIQLGAQDVYIKTGIRFNDLPVRVLVGLTRYLMANSGDSLTELRHRITTKLQNQWKPMTNNLAMSLENING